MSQTTSLGGGGGGSSSSSLRPDTTWRTASQRSKRVWYVRGYMCKCGCVCVWCVQVCVFVCIHGATTGID